MRSSSSRRTDLPRSTPEGSVIMICTAWMSGCAREKRRRARPCRRCRAYAGLTTALPTSRRQVVQMLEQHVGMRGGRDRRAQHHVVERREQHAAIEQIEMDGVLELGPGGALGFRAVARRLAEAEFEPRADARHVPGQRFGREHAPEPFRQIAGAVVHGLVVGGRHELIEAGFEAGERQRVGRRAWCPCPNDRRRDPPARGACRPRLRR